MQVEGPDKQGRFRCWSASKQKKQQKKALSRTRRRTCRVLEATLSRPPSSNGQVPKYEFWLQYSYYTISFLSCARVGNKTKLEEEAGNIQGGSEQFLATF